MRRPGIFGQNGLMVLTSSGDQRSHSRCTDALAHVPHEVHQAGGGIAFLFWQAYIADGGERYKQKSDQTILHNAYPHSATKTHEQINSLAREIHSESKCDTTERQQVTRLKSPKKAANQGHNK